MNFPCFNFSCGFHITLPFHICQDNSVGVPCAEICDLMWSLFFMSEQRVFFLQDLDSQLITHLWNIFIRLLKEARGRIIGFWPENTDVTHKRLTCVFKKIEIKCWALQTEFTFDHLILYSFQAFFLTLCWDLGPILWTIYELIVSLAKNSFALISIVMSQSDYSFEHFTTAKFCGLCKILTWSDN